MTRFATLWILSCLAGVVAVYAAPVAALEIKLHDGRRLHGVALRSTDPASLRLLSGTPRAHIVFPVSWSTIATIVDGDRKWLPKQFEAFRKTIPARSESVESRRKLIADSAPRPAAAAAKTGKKPSAAAPRNTEIRQASAWEPLPRATISQAPGRVRMLEIESWAANWENDPEWDGIVVHIRPLDRRGRFVPASGTIDVVLEAYLPHRMPIYQSKRSVRPIGRWRKAVDRSDYGPDGAVRLPGIPELPSRAPGHPTPRGSIHPSSGRGACTHDGCRCGRVSRFRRDRSHSSLRTGPRSAIPRARHPLLS